MQRKQKRPLITETDLQFTEIGLRMVNIQKKIRKFIFVVLKSISCQLKALGR